MSLPKLVKHYCDEKIYDNFMILYNFISIAVDIQRYETDYFLSVMNNKYTLTIALENNGYDMKMNVILKDEVIDKVSKVRIKKSEQLNHYIKLFMNE